MSKQILLFDGEGYSGTEAPLTADSPDLTKAPTNLTKGASSVKIGDDQSQWQAFSNTGYQGTPVYLQPGNSYPSLKSMELTSPIKSMRASPSH